MKKTIKTLIFVMLFAVLLGCLTACDDFTSVHIEATTENREIEFGETLTVPYTGEEIDLAELFDVKVVKTKTGKRVRMAKPTIRCYLQTSEGPSERQVKEKGEYFVKIEWNMTQENIKYSTADIRFTIIVE